MLRRGLQRAGDRLLVLAGLATVLALVVPSHALAQRSDVVLAALVLFTALGIAPAQLASLEAHKRELGVLVAAPFVALVPLAWLISRLFSGAVRDGVLAVGVSSTEVAAVGLVALSGGSAVLALGALAGSLVVAALLGPVLLGVLAGGAAGVAVGELVARFALVVLVPLVLGLVARAAVPRLEHADGELAGLATLAVVVLVYAAMSGAGEGGDLLPAAAASVLFLAAPRCPSGRQTCRRPSRTCSRSGTRCSTTAASPVRASRLRRCCCTERRARCTHGAPTPRSARWRAPRPRRCWRGPTPRYRATDGARSLRAASRGRSCAPAAPSSSISTPYTPETVAAAGPNA